MTEGKDTLHQKHFAFGIIWLKLAIPETIFSLKIQLFLLLCAQYEDSNC